MKYYRLALFLIATLLINRNFVIGQDRHANNEIIVFSFNTDKGRTLSLSREKDNKYLIYRFGLPGQPDLIFPDSTANSWNQFTYSFYLRGGGVQNEGMDLNYLYFSNKGYKYVIYDNYYAVGNKRQIGIKIINLSTNQTSEIKGLLKSRQGTLVDLRDNDLLKAGDELFD